MPLRAAGIATAQQSRARRDCGSLPVRLSSPGVEPASSRLGAVRATDMCGIAGYLSRTGTDEPVGRVLLDMLTGLARRGPDSAGIACFNPNADGSNVAWVRLPTG